MRAPTGEQFELHLSHEGRTARAIITELAASLRVLEIDSVAVTQPYPEESLPPFGCGIVLAPWPNRVRNGRWELDGTTQQLDLTEPARNNAIHGLLRNAPYTVAERTDTAITLAAPVFPQHGYPFLLDTTVRYELLPGGLAVTHTATNRSTAPAPVAFGVHPFFRIGEVPVEELVLTVEAETRVETDDRLNPIGVEAVDGTRFDLRGGRPVGELELDDAFGDLTARDGRITHTLAAPGGREVRIWQEEQWGWVQVFTTREFPQGEGRGLAVAIEPMTAPPDALNSGQGLRWLDPEETWSASWGVEYAS
ncbi:aldose 1-epimerase family protein [Salinibacterium sp. SYSU T00001]|uniref:aldose 1-epimerase family protein n=1 Tax=Homoserinimonas sedimenticola TaxID=2986805 RepID=UPI002236B85F|nr:aldose 1-epimerase family protein [Salinibacterium sedimenticola]MCW4386088.1 aldose 1-epimerase family protein [Salinibacterium sedimenticola]